MKIGAIIFVFIPFTLLSEVHQEFWSRLSLNYKLNSSWSVVAEFQLRQQKNYLLHKGPSTCYQLTRSSRIWINKKMRKGITLHLSPFAYFRNYDFSKSDSSTMTQRNEFRASIALSKSIQYRKFESKIRLMVENRTLLQPDQWVERVRIQEWFTYKLKSFKNSSLNPYLMGEYFYRYSNRTFGFDQFRLQTGVMFKSTEVDLILGLQWAHQSIEHKTSERIQSQIQLYINL